MTAASTPAEEVARIDQLARKERSPCAEGSLSWRIWGAGPPLVLFHGGHGSWMHWIRSIEYLAGHYTVIVPNFPGHGDSDPPTKPFTPESLAGHLRDGIVHLLGDSAPFRLLAFSFGTIIAGKVARLMPGRIVKLVLVAPAALGVRRGAIGEMIAWRHLSDPAELIAIHTHNLKVLMIDDATKMDALAIHIHHVNMIATNIRTRWISRTHSLREDLPEIDAPMACIWGQGDALVGPYFDERFELFRSVQPALRLEVLPGGHWVQYEQAELFNPLALELLAR